MTNKTNHPSTDATLGMADHSSLRLALNQLVRDELSRSLSVEALVSMLDSGIAGLASLANASSVSEGRLLEKVIAVVAESNPGLHVFTQVRLPIREDALELVYKNPEALYRGLTLDANARTRKVYIADVILVDCITRVAHVVDIKRSLGSYESARILELRQRMLAAALVAPDLLWRDHQRVSIDEVRVVILEAAGKRTDVRNGLWNLTHLDHLLGVPGAADLVRDVRDAFARLSENNLTEARERLRRKQMPDPTPSIAFDGIAREGGKDADVVRNPNRDQGRLVAGRLDDGLPDGIAPRDRRPRIGVALPPPILQ